MHRARTRPLFLVVRLAAEGVCSGPRLHAAEVVFPDIGGPFVDRVGFLRYGNEAPISREADIEELHLSGVLTNHQKRSPDHG